MIDYIFSNDFSKNIDAMIYTCGYETCKPKHSYGPVVRSGYLIHYIISGKGFFQCENKIYHLSKGDAFLIKPNTLIYYEADNDEPWTYTWIGFQGLKIEAYLNRTTFMENLCVNYNENEILKSCHEKMFKAYQLVKNRDLMMNSILYEYLYNLSITFPKTDISQNEKHISYIEEALKYIESNYSEQISINKIAKWLNLDRSYMYRLFKSITGISPQEYLLDFRIRKACDLLKNTGLTITNISRSVGYEDSLYFSRLFKNKKGKTPSEYRTYHKNLYNTKI